MASKVAIGIMRSNAMNRCLDAIPKIAGQLGIPPVDIPTQGRDLDLLHARQLEAQADFYEQILWGADYVQGRLQAFTLEEDALFGHFTDVLDLLTVKQLEDLVAKTGVKPSGTKKEDLIRALIALPVTEPETPEETPEGEGEDTPNGETPEDDASETPEDIKTIED